MRRLPELLLTLSLAACAGRLYSTSKATATKTPDETYTCVQEQLGKLDYERKYYDTNQRWYVGQKADPTARLADVQFRQRVDRLDTRVKPDASGNSSLEIIAHTYDQFSNQQGLSEIERPVSNRAQLDAQTVIQTCGQ